MGIHFRIISLALLTVSSLALAKEPSLGACGLNLGGSLTEQTRSEIAERVYRQLKVDWNNDSHMLWKTYGSNGQTLIAELDKRHLALDEIMSDPGVVFHSTEFIAFLNAHPTLDAAHARTAFRKSMGISRVYRGLALEPAEILAIQTHGIQSNWLRNHGDQIVAPDHGVADSLVLRLTSAAIYPKEIQDQLLRNDFTMSVTDHMDLAAAVANQDTKKALGHTTKVVAVFEIDVPTVDLLYFGMSGMPEVSNLGLPIGDATFEVHNDTPPAQQTIRPSGRKYPYDRHTESFLLYRIMPSEIRAVHIVHDDLGYNK